MNKELKTISTINIADFKEKFKYQIELTEIIDNYNCDFDQNIINEIILWKVNRYSKLETNTFNLLNQIKKESIINDELTKKVLIGLLNSKGIRLAMASTILRFKNPNIYQIIDQRVYRFIYGKPLVYSESKKDKLVDLYLKYLQDLKQICTDKNIDFKDVDRILYLADKKYNNEIKLRGY